MLEGNDEKKPLLAQSQSLITYGTANEASSCTQSLPVDAAVNKQALPHPTPSLPVEVLNNIFLAVLISIRTSHTFPPIKQREEFVKFFLTARILLGKDNQDILLEDHKQNPTLAVEIKKLAKIFCSEAEILTADKYNILSLTWLKLKCLSSILDYRIYDVNESLERVNMNKPSRCRFQPYNCGNSAWQLACLLTLYIGCGVAGGAGLVMVAHPVGPVLNTLTAVGGIAAAYITAQTGVTTASSACNGEYQSKLPLWQQSVSAIEEKLEEYEAGKKTIASSLSFRA